MRGHFLSRATLATTEAALARLLAVHEHHRHQRLADGARVHLGAGEVHDLVDAVVERPFAAAKALHLLASVLSMIDDHGGDSAWHEQLLSFSWAGSRRRLQACGRISVGVGGV